jgi:hypothetical protein
MAISESTRAAASVSISPFNVFQCFSCFSTPGLGHESRHRRLLQNLLISNAGGFLRLRSELVAFIVGKMRCFLTTSQP